MYEGFVNANFWLASASYLMREARRMGYVFLGVFASVLCARHTPVCEDHDYTLKREVLVLLIVSSAVLLPKKNIPRPSRKVLSQ
jgi:hypothetical protein